MQCRRVELSIGALCGRPFVARGPGWLARVPHSSSADCVRLKELNDVNGAARPFERCSKQSSDSPMPPQRNAFRHRDVRQRIIGAGGSDVAVENACHTDRVVIVITLGENTRSSYRNKHDSGEQKYYRSPSREARAHKGEAKTAVHERAMMRRLLNRTRAFWRSLVTI